MRQVQRMETNISAHKLVAATLHEYFVNVEDSVLLAKTLPES